MTDPKHARNVPGRGRYYFHPITDESWPSVTNVLDTAVAKHALKAWAAKATAAKAWQMLPQMVAASRKPTEQERLTKLIKGEHKVISDTARDLGDRVHKRVEAHVLGTPNPDDPEAEPFALQALRFFEDFGVDFERHVEATEATIINRSVGYAGTGDLWAHIPIRDKRRLTLVDYKTSSTRDVDSVYPENGMQTAALAKAEMILLDNGDEVEPPGPVECIAILNLRVNDYALIEMPLNGTIDDAFAGFVGALADARYIHSCYLAKPVPVAKPRLKVA